MKINQKHLVYFEKWFIFWFIRVLFLVYFWFISGLFLVYSWFIFEINQISSKSFGHWGTIEENNLNIVQSSDHVVAEPSIVPLAHNYPIEIENSF